MHSLTINPHKTIKDISCHFNLMVSPFLYKQDKETNISWDIEILLVNRVIDIESDDKVLVLSNVRIL